MSGDMNIRKKAPEDFAGRAQVGLKSVVPPHPLAVLMLGVVSQVSQVLFLRELLMVFHGNELSIGLILAAWLVWVGVGSRLGAILVERSNRSLFLFSCSAAGVLFVVPLTIFAMRVLRGFFDLPPGAYLSLFDMALSCFLLTAPACLIIGAQFVILSKIWRESDRAEDTSGTGKTYVGEAFGNMLGGILFTFILVHYLNAFQTAVLVALLMIGTAIFMNRQVVPAGLRRKGFQPPLLIGLIILAAAVYPLFERLDQQAYRLQWQIYSPQHELIDTYQSKHGTIAVLKLEDQYSFFQSGHLIFSTAGPEAELVGMEEQEAAEFAHFALVQHQNPARVLLIGGGLRGVLPEIIKHPVERVDYIELDEMLTAAAKPHIPEVTLAALSDPRVNLIHADGRLFLKAAEEKYDLIIVDSPDPATAVLNRYYTREFFKEAEALLDPEGVLVTGAISTPDLRGRAVANRNAAIYHTMNQVFSRVLPAGGHFIYYFATNSPGHISLDPLILAERYRERNIEAEGFSAHHFQTLLEDTQLRRINWVIRNHGRSSEAHLQGPEAVPLIIPTVEEQKSEEKKLPPVEEQYFINTDFKPIGYYYTLMFWDNLTRGDRVETFAWLLYVQPWWVLPLSIMPLFVVLVLIKMAGRRKKQNSPLAFAVLLAVFTTGFSTMALQVALLFSFQSIYGFVYEMVGLIVALFMCGLAVGAFLTNRFIKRKAELNLLAVVQLGIALLAVLIALVLPVAAAVQSPSMIFVLFSMLTFGAGLINGVDFPLSAACYMALKGQPEKTAGMVYGVELFGAFAGAVLASTVVIPVLGITACALFAAIVNGSAFIVIIISGRFDKLCRKNLNSQLE